MLLEATATTGDGWSVVGSELRTRPTGCFRNRNGLMVDGRHVGEVDERRDKRTIWGFVLLLVRWMDVNGRLKVPTF